MSNRARIDDPIQLFISLFSDLYCYACVFVAYRKKIICYKMTWLNSKKW